MKLLMCLQSSAAWNLVKARGIGRIAKYSLVLAAVVAGAFLAVSSARAALVTYNFTQADAPTLDGNADAGAHLPSTASR